MINHTDERSVMRSCTHCCNTRAVLDRHKTAGTRTEAPLVDRTEDRKVGDKIQVRRRIGGADVERKSNRRPIERINGTIIALCESAHCLLSNDGGRNVVRSRAEQMEWALRSLPVDYVATPKDRCSSGVTVAL